MHILSCRPLISRNRQKESDSIYQYFSYTQNICYEAKTMINIKSKTVWVLIYDQHHTLDNVGFGNLSQYQPSVFCFNKKYVRLPHMQDIQNNINSENSYRQTWNLSKNLHDPIFRQKNFTHWKRVNWDFFRQQ